MSRTRLLSTPLSFLFSAGSTRPAAGIRLGFKPVSGYDAGKECLDERYFFMDITDIRERRIMVTFHNRATLPCAISDIYFVDGDTFTISVQSIREMDVAAAPACALEVASGTRRLAPEPCHDTSTYQLARRSPEYADDAQDGIRPNESLGIVFDLQPGVTLADIVSALSKGMLNISLKLVGAAQGPGGILVNDSRLGLSPV